MRTAVISDVHGNLEALEAVCRDVDRRSVDCWICLGDVVGYGPDPAACLARTRSLAVCTVMGNHDAAAAGIIEATGFNPHARAAVAWTTAQLKEEELEWLRRRPVSLRWEQARIVHADPIDPGGWGYIRSPAAAAATFSGFDESVCFVGHTHSPFVCAHDGTRVREPQHDTGAVVALREGWPYLANVGSVGQPRDGDCRACYAVWDSDAETIQLVRVPYDIERTQQKMTAAGLPAFLVERLALGY